jgi:hypothetical protein
MNYSGQNSPARILSATQIFVLNAAADHTLRRVEAFPDSVNGGARTKVLAGLAARGLIVQVKENYEITPAGFAAIGREVPKPAKVKKAKAEKAPKKAPIAPNADAPVKKERAPTKQNILTSLIQREGGAAISVLMAATGWQKHSVCGALSTLNKILGGTIQSEKRDGERVYWIGEAPHQVEVSA